MIIAAIVSGGIGLISAVFSGVILAKMSKASAKSEKRYQEKVEREVLTLKSLDACMAVNKELVRCARGEKPNGELTEAFQYQTDVKHQIEDYMRRQTAEKW